MTINQQRLLQTAITGPRSVELHARKTAAVASGVGTTLPVYVERAVGGIVVVLRFLPPLVIGDNLLTKGLDILEFAMDGTL